jgi:YegS/Rv2252/BmrU family lipid kinase
LSYTFGKTLLVINPASQLGHGDIAGKRAEELLRMKFDASSSLEVVRTQGPNDAVEIGKDAQGYDSILVLGGDGVINEVANGLMELPFDKRPVMGVLPVGSGNDYAKTLHMSYQIDQAVEQLFSAKPQAADVGLCNGRYFVETLSFGLDAAIALDTVERRRRTGKTGLALYGAASAYQLSHHRDTHDFIVSVDGSAPRHEQMILFAVQIGPSYGGGFCVCPEASISDGIFDICVARPPIGVVEAALMFLFARNGHHTHFKKLELSRAKSLVLDFDHDVKVQIDGEPLPSRHYEISSVPHALRVLIAQN